jgi:hypothetical protein
MGALTGGPRLLLLRELTPGEASILRQRLAPLLHLRRSRPGSSQAGSDHEVGQLKRPPIEQ